MHFTQHIIAAFALFSTYTFANPLPATGIQVAGLPRKAALGDLGPEFCGGFTTEGCTAKCLSLGYEVGICETLYVVLITLQHKYPATEKCSIAAIVFV